MNITKSWGFRWFLSMLMLAVSLLAILTALEAAYSVADAPNITARFYLCLALEISALIASGYFMYTSTHYEYRAA
jgi:hypothetical protein